MQRPFIWAHRGDSAWAPENTMAAFVAAIDSGADGIELDVHLSGDGVPVVIHDDTLDRTTDGLGGVACATSQEIAGLDAGSWFSPAYDGEPVPLLREVLEAFGGRVRLNLEIKDVRAGLSVLALLRNAPDVDAVVSSFDYDVLRQLRGAAPELPIAVLFASGNWRRALRVAQELGACSFHPEKGVTSRPLVAACRRAGLQVHVWTVDLPLVAKSLARAGVTGFFSNDPEYLKNAFI